ncbi:glycosyltransferase [Roseospira goensis]|uniref:Glycosyltransferase involved in cell wall biosynthesis n=1 Tax=Roseospira goensis TaxID=391922 RepID=A0A7W6WK65_9PROT|nr:glycosyltransferase [Roseospira goensis]MBB4285810.1 glycosyltransferase involved in cell wall biosynthesis [Roseospira goensis]
MRILFADDGVAYDGRTPAEEPLGGGERAVVGLARALAARGHVVSVATPIIDPVRVDGVAWLPLPMDEGDRSLPDEVDVLVAVRRPSLLSLPVRPGRRVLWVLGRPDYLIRPSVRARLANRHPDLLYISESQRAAGPDSAGMGVSVLAPGVAPAFLDRAAPAPAEPPVAVATVHPVHGDLGWLLDRWEHGIGPAVPAARLHLYSALLSAGLAGEPVPEALTPTVARVRALAGHGVEVREPQPEAALADAWRTARVFLHPGAPWDHACWPLAEAQALGLPAVARPLGGASERISNGDSGMLVPDDDAFVNVTIQILTDDGLHAGMVEEARASTRRRGWGTVADELEAHWFRFGR